MLVPVYDIVNCGPRKRFVANGKLVHNSDKVNLQNLPSRGDNANTLKKAIAAPKGYVVIDSDSSQIEARVLAWLAGQDDLVETFEKNNEEIRLGVPKEEMVNDPYKIMASKIYHTPVENISSSERFMGKTVVLGCFAADTMVLTHRGWKPIVRVQSTDMLWDGEEWVTHLGVVEKGVKETIRAWGVDATPDHEILTGHGWRAWSEVITNPTLSQSAFSRASLPSLDGSNMSNQKASWQGGTRLLDVLAVGKGKLIEITSKPSGLLDAHHAHGFLAQKLESITGGMKRLFRTKRIESDYSTEYLRAFLGVITHAPEYIRTMVGVGLRSTFFGGQIGQSFSNTLLLLKDGTSQLENSIGSTTTKDMNRGIYASPLEPRTLLTEEVSRGARKRLMTYDIAYAGPRNRFTVATDAGNLIVHNCGYGMGAAKFKAQVAQSGVWLSELESSAIINTYRTTYDRIPALWKQGQACLEAMLKNQVTDIGVQPRALTLTPHGFLLPSGFYLDYSGLEKDEMGEFSYLTRAGRKKIYGGKVIENVCQAIARCIIAEQMTWIAKRYKVVLTVHDAIACVVKEDEAQEAADYIESCMRKTPAWAEGLPLNCEYGIGHSYGEC